MVLFESFLPALQHKLRADGWQDARPSTDGNWLSACPSCGGHGTILSTKAGDGGKLLACCHHVPACNYDDIVRAVGLTPKGDSPADDRIRYAVTTTRPRTAAKAEKPVASKPGRTYATADEARAALIRFMKLGKPSEVYDYPDAAGELLMQVVRWDLPGGGKEIRPLSRHAEGWMNKAMPEPRPLYRLPDLAAADVVIVCEGEKCADKARALGYVATTSAGGAGAAAKTDWAPLAGKEVRILPDNDAAGREYADTVARTLTGLEPPAVVRMIHLPNLPVGGDIVDWVDAHGDAAEPAGLREELESLAADVLPWRPDDDGDDDDTTNDNDLEYKPFPVDALPEPIRGLVDAGSRAIGCDPAYIALPALVAAGAAIGNTRRMMVKRSWLALPTLWGVIVGESGTLKTPAFKLVMGPIRDRQADALERYGEEAKEYEAAKAAWERDFEVWKKKGAGEKAPEKPLEPVCERLLVSEPTVEALAPILMGNPRGLLLARDELAGWFGSHDRYATNKSSADESNWLSMYNAETIVVDRKTAIPRTIFVRNAAVSVCGGIQPGILKRVLGRKQMESGLAGRLLMAYPPRTVKVWTEADIDESVENAFKAMFDRLFALRFEEGDDGKPKPAMVKMTAEAKAVWVNHYTLHNREGADLAGDLAAAWSKLEEIPARLALVIHFARWANGEVADPRRLDDASMTAAICLAGWFKHEARRVYAVLSESDQDRDQRRLVEWITGRGGSATAREAQQGCRWLKASGAAETALEELVKAGRGEWRDATATTKGGRPARRFVLAAST